MLFSLAVRPEVRLANLPLTLSRYTSKNVKDIMKTKSRILSQKGNLTFIDRNALLKERVPMKIQFW